MLLSTAGSVVEAESIARALVEEGLAACCNLLPGVRSIYRWQGKVEEGEEALMIFKSLASNVDAIKARLVTLHSYTTPELIVLPIEGGLESYLEWIRDNAKGG